MGLLNQEIIKTTEEGEVFNERQRRQSIVKNSMVFLSELALQ